MTTRKAARRKRDERKKPADEASAPTPIANVPCAPQTLEAVTPERRAEAMAMLILARIQVQSRRTEIPRR